MLRVEATGQLASLDGLQHCWSLNEVDMFGVRVENLAPLAGLTKLRKLRICGDPDMRHDNLLDLADLSGLQNLHTLVLPNAGRIRSLGPLRSLPNLRDVRLGGTTIVDGDLEPLVRLPVDTNVVGPND
jgi:hypothetical protein